MTSTKDLHVQNLHLHGFVPTLVFIHFQAIVAHIHDALKYRYRRLIFFFNENKKLRHSFDLTTVFIVDVHEWHTQLLLWMQFFDY